MYPKNAASPERIAIGAVVQISDGAVQTSGVSIKVKPQGNSASAGGGTTSYEEGVVEYLPTQAETNYTSFTVIAYKSGCIPVAHTVITSDSATPGTVKLAPVTHTSAVVPTVSAVTGLTAAAVHSDLDDIQSRLPAALVSGRMDSSVGAMAADVLTAAAAASDFGTEVGTAVWATTTRALTVLDEDSTTLDLDATIRAAVGMASANLDTQLDALPTNAELATALGTADDAILAVLGTPAGASISADIAAIEAQTDDIGAAGAGLTALASAADLATLAAYVDTEVAAIKVVTDKIDTIVQAAPGSPGEYRFTEDALELAPVGTGGGAPSAAAIADAVWDEILSGHAISGSTGEALSAAGGAGDPWITALPGSYTAGQAGYIVGTNVNATISSRATQTSVDDVPTNAELATALGTADDAVLAAIDALPTATEVWAAGTRTLTAIDEDSTTLDLDATIRAAVGMSSANLDTQIGDLPTNAELATSQAAADDATLAAIAALTIPTAGAVADAVWDEATSGHVSAGTTGLALVNTDLRGSRTVIRGTSAGSATTTTMTPSALTPAGVDADQFKGRILIFDNDTTTTALRGQATDITANTAAGLPLLTFTALTTAPASGDSFSIV